MKKILTAVLLMAALTAVLAGCASDTFTFTCTIDEIGEGYIYASSCTANAFDEAIVNIASDIELPDGFAVGQTVKVTALNAMSLSEPAQVTAVKIEIESVND